MSAVSSKRVKKVDPLSKRVPENPKYKHVKSTIDTGASLNRYLAKIEDIRSNYRYKQNEQFKRMKLTTFAQLVLQVAQYDEDIETDRKSIDSGRPESCSTDFEIQDIQRNRVSPVPSLAVTEGDYGAPPDIETSRSTLQRDGDELDSVIRGVGEVDLNAAPPPPLNRFVDNNPPYLLLDVRDQDAFNECHIITAYNYPIAMLSRSCNNESKELRSYKNQPGKIIVMYDDDERLAPNAATRMTERGYENLFMLSGGLKVASKVFPKGFITGSLPQAITGVKPKTVEPATQKHFTSDDLDIMGYYLDDALLDKSIGSRLSKAGTASSRMGNQSQMSTARSVKSQAGSVQTARPAFKP